MFFHIRQKYTTNRNTCFELSHQQEQWFIDSRMNQHTTQRGTEFQWLASPAQLSTNVMYIQHIIYIYHVILYYFQKYPMSWNCEHIYLRGLPNKHNYTNFHWKDIKIYIFTYLMLLKHILFALNIMSGHQFLMASILFSTGSIVHVCNWCCWK